LARERGDKRRWADGTKIVGSERLSEFDLGTCFTPWGRLGCPMGVPPEGQSGGEPEGREVRVRGVEPLAGIRLMDGDRFPPLSSTDFFPDYSKEFLVTGTGGSSFSCLFLPERVLISRGENLEPPPPNYLAVVLDSAAQKNLIK